MPPTGSPAPPPAGEAVPFDRIAERYDQSRGGERRGAEMAADIEPWLRPGTVLEVGVGTGVVAVALAARGWPVVGVDLSPAMLVRARARLGARVSLGDARRLPLTGSIVDNVTEPTDLDAAIAPLAALRSGRADRPDLVDAAARAAGLKVVHDGVTSPRPLSRSPRETVETIERRDWSYLWNLDEDEWRRLAVPALAALRALPDPDLARPATARHRLTVYTR